MISSVTSTAEKKLLNRSLENNEYHKTICNLTDILLARLRVRFCDFLCVCARASEQRDCFSVSVCVDFFNVTDSTARASEHVRVCVVLLFVSEEALAVCVCVFFFR